MRTFLCPAVALLWAAAPPAAMAQRPGETGGAMDLQSGRFAAVFSTEPVRAPDTIAASPVRTFAVLPRAFEALGVPISLVDTAAVVLGAVRVLVRRPIGGDRLSLLLECGNGSYGPNADRYSVQLTMLAAVRAVDSTHSEVHTRVEGSASPNGLNTNVRCGSTGRLEERFVALLRRELEP